ncbi:MAG: hypothetical protein II404_07425 [Prevotella sp.]|nr:hypothetical protein [Prevotella sp.]
MEKSSSQHHHHHRHRKDQATRFKERSLNAIVLRRRIEKWLKIFLLVVALAMVATVVYLYFLA